MVQNVGCADVDERDLGKRTIALDCPVGITTDAYPGKVYKGRVGFISSEQEFTPKTVQTDRERVKFVYRVKIYVDNPNKELKPGMPADARLVRTETQHTHTTTKYTKKDRKMTKNKTAECHFSAIIFLPTTFVCFVYFVVH